MPRHFLLTNTRNQFLKSHGVRTAKSILLRENQGYNSKHICSKLITAFRKPRFGVQLRDFKSLQGRST